MRSAGPLTGLLLPVEGRVRTVELPADMGPGSQWWPLTWVETIAGRHVAWCTRPQPGRPQPPNEAAWALAARLGLADLAHRIGLNGDLLLVGVTADGTACEVPRPVVEAAARTGLLGHPSPADARRTTVDARPGPAAGVRTGQVRAR